MAEIFFLTWRMCLCRPVRNWYKTGTRLVQNWCVLQQIFRLPVRCVQVLADFPAQNSKSDRLYTAAQSPDFLRSGRQKVTIKVTKNAVGKNVPPALEL